MGVVETNPKEIRFWHGLFLAGLIAGLVLRFHLASFAQMPGHGDSAFYYTVAKNIAEGRGPVVDYIVYFFSGLLPLPHYAGDFWNPSASFLIAIPMILFGKTISSALLAPMAAGIIPAIAGYAAGRYFSKSVKIGALTGIITFFSPFQVWFSTTTEAIIFAGAFGSMAIYFMMRGFKSPRCFLLAALCTGLANLIRQDDILLLAVLGICILFAATPRKNKVLIGIAAISIHFLILSPLLLKNYAELHALFPPGPARTTFLTTYEDFHSYGKEIDWKTLRATWGILGIFNHRWHTALENLGQVNYFLDSVFTVLLFVSLADILLIHRDRNKLLLLIPASLFAIFEYLFYTLIASFSGPGSLIKSLGVLMPFVCLLIVYGAAHYLRPSLLLTAAIILLSVYAGHQGFEKNYDSTIYYNRMYQAYTIVRTTILNDASRRGINAADITVLARDTWDVYEGTGFKTVMVPNNDIDTIVFVAQHYEARYILLPALRPQLDKIYNNTTPDPRFTYVASITGSDMKIFRINFSP
ncbi:MAG TPA: glycosyltransferase family 39 protein [Anaerolineales bacterium]|nr:glycosyltransferase family 39 protein [Anaerolineales bacterium]